MAATVDRELDLPHRGRILVREASGPPGAATVVLLHGLGATGHLNWAPSFGPLAEYFRVISVDHRGHGRGIRTQRFRLEDCADDVAAALTALGVARFIAVGYSMGGPIAKLVWRRHRWRVAGLVLCATARHFTSPSVAPAAKAVLNAASNVARMMPGVVRRQMLRRILSQIDRPAVRARVAEELVGHDPAAVLQAAAAVATFSSHSWVGDVDVPTAVIVTTRDEIVPPVRQRKLAASIRNAIVFEVEGDHVACVAAASRFVPALVRACRYVDAESRRTAGDSMAGQW